MILLNEKNLCFTSQAVHLFVFNPTLVVELFELLTYRFEFEFKPAAEQHYFFLFSKNKWSS